MNSHENEQKKHENEQHKSAEAKKVLTSEDVSPGTEPEEGQYLTIEEKNRRRNEGQTAVTYTEKDGTVKEKITGDPNKTTDPKKTDPKKTDK